MSEQERNSGSLVAFMLPTKPVGVVVARNNPVGPPLLSVNISRTCGGLGVGLSQRNNHLRDISRS